MKSIGFWFRVYIYMAYASGELHSRASDAENLPIDLVDSRAEKKQMRAESLIESQAPTEYPYKNQLNDLLVEYDWTAVFKRIKSMWTGSFNAGSGSEDSLKRGVLDFLQSKLLTKLDELIKLPDTTPFIKFMSLMRSEGVLGKSFIVTPVVRDWLTSNLPTKLDNLSTDTTNLIAFIGKMRQHGLVEPVVLDWLISKADQLDELLEHDQVLRDWFASKLPDKLDDLLQHNQKGLVAFMNDMNKVSFSAPRVLAWLNSNLPTKLNKLSSDTTELIAFLKGMHDHGLLGGDSPVMPVVLSWLASKADQLLEHDSLSGASEADQLPRTWVDELLEHDSLSVVRYQITSELPGQLDDLFQHDQAGLFAFMSDLNKLSFSAPVVRDWLTSNLPTKLTELSADTGLLAEFITSMDEHGLLGKGSIVMPVVLDWLTAKLDELLEQQPDRVIKLIKGMNDDDLLLESSPLHAPVKAWIQEKHSLKMLGGEFDQLIDHINMTLLPQMLEDRKFDHVKLFALIKEMNDKHMLAGAVRLRVQKWFDSNLPDALDGFDRSEGQDALDFIKDMNENHLLGANSPAMPAVQKWMLDDRKSDPSKLLEFIKEMNDKDMLTTGYVEVSGEKYDDWKDQLDTGALTIIAQPSDDRFASYEGMTVIAYSINGGGTYTPVTTRANLERICRMTHYYKEGPFVPRCTNLQLGSQLTSLVLSWLDTNFPKILDGCKISDPENPDPSKLLEFIKEMNDKGALAKDSPVRPVVLDWFNSNLGEELDTLELCKKAAEFIKDMNKDHLLEPDSPAMPAVKKWFSKEKNLQRIDTSIVIDPSILSDLKATMPSELFQILETRFPKMLDGCKSDPSKLVELIKEMNDKDVLAEGSPVRPVVQAWLTEALTEFYGSNNRNALDFIKDMNKNHLLEPDSLAMPAVQQWFTDHWKQIDETSGKLSTLEPELVQILNERYPATATGATHSAVAALETSEQKVAPKLADVRPHHDGNDGRPETEHEAHAPEAEAQVDINSADHTLEN